MAEFVHLHVHSYYSLLDGCSSPIELARGASQAGMAALALTDHDALYGAIEFYDACRAEGVRPVLGLELAVNMDTSELPGAPDGQGPHVPSSLILLARDLTGYANLCRLSSALQTQPDRESALRRGLPLHELEGQTAGLIALSGGKRGQLDRLLRAGRLRDAERAAAAWAERFDKDGFFVELQIQHPGDAEIASALDGLAKRLGLGTVATNNVHYLHPQQASQCRLLAAMHAVQPLAETPPREGLHLALPGEMANAFADYPDAVDNTVALTHDCRLELPLGQPRYPEIELPAGRTAGQQLREQALAGAQERYGSVDDAVQDRLDHEISIIDSMGYSPLLLIVADIVRFAHEQGIPINLRGSAASSLAAYCLGISAVDPLALGLYFERFLNPGRRDPPDIDLDLCSRRRDQVIEYVYQRYGRDRVATICTYARLRARSAWREVAKAYDLPQSRIDAIARKVPHLWHPGMWSEVEAAKEELLSATEDALEREALVAAWALDEHPRHLSVHPGGVVITPGPLTELVPLQRAAKGVIITQYDLASIERLGLVKIDLLGIRALTVVAEGVELVRQRAPGFSLEAIPDRDPATGELLSGAATIGCFQMESPGMRRTLLELGTRTLEDVAVTLALYKPGPLRGGLKDAFVRRHRGEEAARYLHPALEPILKSTHGVILYQEQVLRIAHELAGFSLAEADRLRRGIAHLGHGDEMVPLRNDFVERVERVSGVPANVAARLWDMMFSFAGYGFLKAHAASYAVVAYRTAYLKAHHPAEFMTAILRNWGGYYPQRIYLGEARRMGLEVRPPHVNHSGRRFELAQAPDGHAILWMGLGQVRELTRKTVAAILKARRERPFGSLDDLLQRAGPRLVEAENLVKAGALDGLGPGRRALLAELKGRTPGAPLQLALPWDARPEGGDTLLEKLALEIEMLGWPASAHPLAPFANELTALGVVRSDALAAFAGQRARVAGARLGLWREQRGWLTLEDEGGLFSVRLPKGHRLPPGPLGKLGPYRVVGRIQVNRANEVTVMADEIEPLYQLASAG